MNAGLPRGAVGVCLAIRISLGVILFDLLGGTATSFVAGLPRRTIFDEFVFGVADFEGAVFGFDIAFAVRITLGRGGDAIGKAWVHAASIDANQRTPALCVFCAIATYFSVCAGGTSGCA